MNPFYAMRVRVLQAAKAELEQMAEEASRARMIRRAGIEAVKRELEKCR